MLDKLRSVANRYDQLCFQSEQGDFYADPKKATLDFTIHQRCIQ